MKAVIDRFEGDYAVLLVGDAEEKRDVPRNQLPPGAKEGSWLFVRADGYELDPKGEKQQREKIENLLQKLKNKNKDK